MFKQAPNANELAESMRRGLLSEDAEDHTHVALLTEAVECMDQAASLLEEIGLHKEADDITTLLEKIGSN